MQKLQEFQILDEKRYPIKTVNNRTAMNKKYRAWVDPRFTNKDDLLSFWRWEHRATIGRNAREYMVFVDQLKQVLYIEEITGGHLEEIKDDSLFEALLNFVTEKEFGSMQIPILKPKSERFL